MELGIGGRKAIVCAASKGLGRACAEALAENGVALVVNARGRDALEAAAASIRAGPAWRSRPWRPTSPRTRAARAVLAACPDADILINNAGGPPPGDFRDWGEDAWLAALRANMLTPIELMRSLVDGMSARGFGRIVNITSAAVKAPIAELGLSNGARAGLTGFVAGLARAVAGKGVTINNILPGRFATDRLTSNLAANAARRGVRSRRSSARPAPRSRPAGSATPMSSASSAPSCARPMPATSPGRTC